MPAAGERDEDAEQTMVRSRDMLELSGAPGDAPPKSGARGAAAPVPPAEPSILDPYAPAGGAWPGTEPVRRERPAGGLDPKILIVVAALMVVAVGGAYLAGRAGAPPAGLAGAASAPAPARRPAGGPPAGGPSNAEPRPTPDGIATRVAGAIARSLDSVGRACEIEPGAPGDLLRRAFVQCGSEPLAPPKAPSRAEASPATDAPPEPPAPGTRPPPPPVAPAPVAPSNARCLNACDRQHKACKADQCGSEPAEGSKYKAHQDCLGKCLVDFSRCRLDCQ
jgi:hypothetical protein